jgi:hypothetical protein
VTPFLAFTGIVALVLLAEGMACWWALAALRARAGWFIGAGAAGLLAVAVVL